MRKPRLVIATDTFLPRRDGVSIFLARIIPRLCEEYAVTLITPAFGILPELSCVEFDLHGVGRRIADYQFPRLTREGKRRITTHVSKADVVFTQTIGPLGSFTLRAAWRLGKPSAAFIHSREWELFSKSIHAPEAVRRLVERGTLHYMRRVYALPRLLITPTDEVGMLLKAYGIRTPSTTVPLGVNTLHFTPPLNPARVKRSFGLDLRNVTLGFVGRLALEKDPLTLVRAFIYLRKKYAHLRLLLVGPGREDLVRQVERVEGVIYTGEVEDPREAYQAMDIFVLPSLTETTGLALLEAMSTALPVVSTRVGVAPLLITPGETGFFFPKRDWLRLAKTLEPLIQDALLRQRIGRAARRRVQAEREEKVMIDKLLTTLRTVREM